VHLDGPQGDEEGLRDLLVGLALSGELDDAELGGGERVAAGLWDAAWAGARESQFVACVADQCGGAAAMGEIGALRQRCAGVSSLAGPADGAPEVDHGAGVLEPRTAGGKRIDGVGQGRLIGVVGQGLGAERDADRARGAEAPGERELVVGEAARGGEVAEREVADRGLRAPCDRADAGPGLPVALEALALAQCLERRLRLALGGEQVGAARSQRLAGRGLGVVGAPLEGFERLAGFAQSPVLDEHEDERRGADARCDRPSGHGRLFEAEAGGSSPKAVVVDPTAIPWLRLSASGTAGPDGDRLAGTTYIQRINTTGGLIPPPDTCNPGTVGNTNEVHYTADYYFWKAAQ
jgi:hypothetical protein